MLKLLRILGYCILLAIVLMTLCGGGPATVWATVVGHVDASLLVDRYKDRGLEDLQSTCSSSQSFPNETLGVYVTCNVHRIEEQIEHKWYATTVLSVSVYRHRNDTIGAYTLEGPHPKAPLKTIDRDLKIERMREET